MQKLAMNIPTTSVKTIGKFKKNEPLQLQAAWTIDIGQVSDENVLVDSKL